MRANIMLAVERKERPPMTSSKLTKAPTGFEAIIRSCWAHEASNRPRFSELLHALQDMQLAWAHHRFAMLSSKGVHSHRSISYAHVLGSNRSTEQQRRRSEPSDGAICVVGPATDRPVHRSTEDDSTEAIRTGKDSPDRNDESAVSRSIEPFDMISSDNSNKTQNQGTSSFSRRKSNFVVRKASKTMRKFWAARDASAQN